MEHAPARNLTAGGFALITAAALVAVPTGAGQPVASGLTHRAAVLAATGDGLLDNLDLSNWSDLVTNTENAITGLGYHLSAPLPALQQLLVNQAGNADHLLTGDFGGLVSSIGAHATGALEAPFVPFAGDAADGVYPSLDGTSATVTGTGAGAVLSGLLGGSLAGTSHADLIHDIAGMLGASGSDGAFLNDLIGLTGSPLSGLLWGGLTTVLSPLVQGGIDAAEVIGNLGVNIQDPFLVGVFNPEAAITALLNAPANIVDAFLNGTTVDVSSVSVQQLLSLISDIPGMSSTVDAINAAMPDLGGYGTVSLSLGGLLSPGGSLFDALGLNGFLSDGTLGSLDLSLPGVSVGPIGSLIELGQSIAHGLGWDDFSKMPLDGVLSGLDPTDVAGAAAAVDPSDLLSLVG